MLVNYHPASTEPEIIDLQALTECGFPVARMVVVPSAVEEEFYRLNNLAVQLEAHFAGIDPSDPDDEDIEDLAPGAEVLVNGRYLLDEFIDRFYELISSLPDDVRVRRPGENGSSGRGGRGSLLSVKRAWSSDWLFEPLWARLSSGGPLLPTPRGLLLHAAALDPLPHALARDASALLGKPLSLFGEPATGISRIIELPASGRVRDRE